MVTTKQRFGTMTMFAGSFLYMTFLAEISTAPEIGVFQLMLAISTLIIGGILLLRPGGINDRFMKTLGVSVYLIGLGYECRSAFVFSDKIYTYASCVLGGLLMILGLISMYLLRGKPSVFAIKFHLYLGALIGLWGCMVMTLDIMPKIRTTTLRFQPETIDKIYINISIGSMFWFNALLQYYLRLKKTKDQVEPDLVFYGDENIFVQIFY